MEKDNTIYLRNIIDKAEEALGFCNNRTLEEFLENNMLQSAVVLKLIIIGEEARKIPKEITSSINLPWRLIVGFRNMAVHEYFELDLNQIWVTMQEDIPDLVHKINSYLNVNAKIA